MLKGITLRDYQTKILDDLKSVPSIGLFIKTGGGKTLTSLERFTQNPTNNLLVICPQKVVTQWIGVIEKHTDLKPYKYKMAWSAKKKWEHITKNLDKSRDNAIVVNFDIVKDLNIEDYIDSSWTIIVDESHKIKNMGSSRSPVKITKKVLELGKLTDYKIILTATPTEKELGGYIDYYSQLTFLGYLDMSERLFKNRYCREDKLQLPGMPFPIKKIVGYRMDLIDKEIKPILQATCRFYAPKYGDYEPQKVKIDIPRCDNYATLLRDRAYKEITFDNVSAMRIGKKTLTGGRITGTDEYKDRRIYDDNTNKKDWLVEFLSNTDDIVSIIYNYNVEKEMIIEACEKLKKKYVVIDGSVKDKPAELEKDFDVIIGQFEAFGESLDGLQHKCHLMVFYSMPDSSRAYKQTLGRIDRIGQEEMPVYYHLVMERTIEENIYEMIENKIEFSEKDLESLSI